MTMNPAQNPPNWQLDTNWTLSSLSTSGDAGATSYANWTPGHPERHTPFENLVEGYADYQRSRGLRSARKIPYELALFGRWLASGGLEVADVTPRLAEEYQSWLTSLEDDGVPHYASRTIAAMVCTTEGFYRWLTQSAITSGNPFHRMRRVKTDNSLPRELLSVGELAGKLAQVREFWKLRTLRERKSLYRLHVITEVFYATGIRLSELADLTPADIDWEAGTLLVREGKGGAARLAWLNEYALSVLEIYVKELRVLLVKDGASTLFGVAGGRALEKTINTPLKVRLGMTSHGLRHCLGTHLLARGCDLRFIQLILGHQSLSSTSLYTRVSKEDLRGQLDLHHPRGG